MSHFKIFLLKNAEWPQSFYLQCTLKNSRRNIYLNRNLFYKLNNSNQYGYSRQNLYFIKKNSIKSKINFPFGYRTMVVPQPCSVNGFSCAQRNQSECKEIHLKRRRMKTMMVMWKELSNSKKQNS